MVRYIAGAIFSIVLVGNCFATTQSPSESIKVFLNAFDDDKSTRYIGVFRDLNNDGAPEAIVYLMGNKWCGSGGCTTLILTQDGNSWKIIKRITISQLPIRVLSRKSNGWHDIGVWTRGGGAIDGYESVLSFKGKNYNKMPYSFGMKSGTKMQGDDVITSSMESMTLW